MPTYRSVSGSSAEDLFIELFSDTFGAEKAGYPGNLPPHNWFTEDERKSRRKPWRFYDAWAVTSARSAGGFRGWSWRCSDQPNLRLALFFLKSRLNPRCDRLSGGADAIRRGF